MLSGNDALLAVSLLLAGSAVSAQDRQAGSGCITSTPGQADGSVTADSAGASPLT